MEGARIIGAISGSSEAPIIAFLKPGVGIDLGIASRLGQLAATQVFRFAATCEEGRCAHFDGGKCKLANRIVGQLPDVVDVLPACQIRTTCRWYQEQGPSACRKCPQILTMIPKRPDALNRAAATEEESV